MAMKPSVPGDLVELQESIQGRGPAPSSGRLTVRFPHVDAAAIGFYPRYIEMINRCFPQLPLESAPMAFSLEFPRPIRLGDILDLSLARDEAAGTWLVSARNGTENCFTAQSFGHQSHDLSKYAHEPSVPAFKSAPWSAGKWAVGQTGKMQLSRTFERLSESIEEWFEYVLDIPFHQLHVDRNIAIPTVKLNTTCRKLPDADDEVRTWIRVKKLGGRSMSFTSWFVRDNECLMAYDQIVVFGKALEEGFQSIPIPEFIRQKFAKAPGGIG